METNKDWNPGLYLKFEEERTRPSRDLVARIDLPAPGRILDVGCGPGNGTPGILAKWPGTELSGIDTSPAMVAEARKKYPVQGWTVGDARRLPSGQTWDLVFSNAVIQWLPDHPALFDHWFGAVAPGGAVAVQVPQYLEMPVSRLADTIFRNIDRGRSGFDFAEVFTNHPAGFYDNLLRPRVRRFDLWETTYFHPMVSAQAIVEMLRSTGMKPYLDQLGNPSDREAFERAVTAGVADTYPAQADGMVLFPFRRLFFVAYR